MEILWFLLGAAVLITAAILTIANAGHGLSYPVDPEKYLTALRDFFGKEASYPE